MSRQELNELRTGWDIIFDPDVKDFEIAKLVTKQIIEALKDHGVKNYFVKYTGGKGFHILVPFESLPDKINLKPTQILYPETLQKIIEYIKWYIHDSLKEALLDLDTPNNLSKRIGKPLSDILNEEGLEPFKVITMDIFGSRHLFRLPYSLHEKSLLVSLPINPDRIEKFEKEEAEPKRVKPDISFFTEKSKLHDAEALVIEALDWASKHLKEKKTDMIKSIKFVKKRFVPEKFFPPCIKEILNGMTDGRKRSVFILINFLRNMGWDIEKIEKRLYEWNEKNSPPLRANYIRGQLRWHFRQDRNLLPPNCENKLFYFDMGICKPDAICKNNTEKVVIKNPVNYPFKKLKRIRKIK